MSGAVERIGSYRIVRPIGEGAQGAVYLAQDERLDGRAVALKVLTSRDVRAVGRFRNEALAASRLDHPHICTVYEVGEADGHHFIAMRYVRGQSLRELINEERARLERGDRTRAETFRLLRILGSVARALHAAHDAGLVHRDLKPENIMLDEDGSPVILDFGLAHINDDIDGGLTRTGDIVGTPLYAAPEQFSGKMIDRRADVYALGVTALECVTLERPFDGVTFPQLVMQVVRGEIRIPDDLTQRTTRDLETVLRKAFDPTRSRRYPTALAFAKDLEDGCSFLPVSARSPRMPERVWLWARRNPVVAGFSLALFLALAAGLLVALSLLTKVNEEQGRTEDSLRVARSRGLASLSLGARDLDSTRALLLARRAVEADASPQSIGSLYGALATVNEIQHVRLDGIVVAGLAHDTATDDILVCTPVGGVYRIGRDGAVEFLMPFPDAVIEVASHVFSRDGHRLLVVSVKGAVHVMNLEDKTSLELKPGFDAWSGRFVAGDRRVLVVGHEGELVTFDVTGRLEHRLDTSPCGRTHVARVSGDRLVVGCSLGRTTLYDLASGSRVHSTDLGSPPEDIAILRDGTLLVVTQGGRAYRCSASGETTCESLLGAFATAVEVDPGGTVAAFASAKGVVALYRPDDTAPVLLVHAGAIERVDFRSSTELVTTTREGVATLWSVDGRNLGRIGTHGESVSGLRFVSGRNEVLTWNGGHSIHRWALRPPYVPLLTFPGTVLRVAASKEGRSVAVGMGDGTVYLASPDDPAHARVLPGTHWTQLGVQDLCWEEETGVLWAAIAKGLVLQYTHAGELRHSYSRVPESESTLAQWITSIEPTGRDGEYVSTGWDGSVHLVRDGERVASARHTHSLTAGCYQPDARRMLATARNGDVLEWDLTGSELSRFATTGAWPIDVKASRSLVVTGHFDGTAYVWGRAGELIATLRHPAPVQAVAVTESGDRILTAAGRDVRIWDRTGAELARIPAHRATVRDIALTADERRFVTGSDDGAVRLWPLVDPATLLRIADGAASRDLTDAERAELSSAKLLVETTR